MNVRRDERAEIVGQWMEKAEHDYAAVMGLLAGEELNCPYDIICFHAQQYVEKYFKAVGVSLSAAIPRTHDLIELTILLPAILRSTLDLAELAELNPYAVDVRYPGFMENVSMKDANRAFDITVRIRSTCRKYLQQCHAATTDNESKGEKS
jgi:HEPN domain-containing protein